MNENNVQMNLNNTNNGVPNGQVNTPISDATQPSVNTNVVQPLVMPLNSEEFPIITNYCENLTTKKYVTNPAIAREEEIKKQC